MDTAKEICTRLNEAGKNAFLVGGSVRDMLLAVPKTDLDFTTNALPNEIKSTFKSFPLFNIGEKFGTITVLLNGEKCEITTFRSESEFTEKRNELNITFETELKKDLERRDFTVNAMAFNPCTGELIDLFNGSEDLKNHIIRFVGVPSERIREDPLRMLRAIRFAGKLDSIIEFNSFNAIKTHASLIKNVAFERIKDELLKILSLEDCELSLHLLEKTGILAEIIPELARLKEVKQPLRFHRFNVLHHSFETVLNTPNSDPFLRFVALLHDIGKTEARRSSPFFPEHEFKGEIIFKRIAKRFKLSTEETQRGTFLIRMHMTQFGFPNTLNNSRAQKRFLSNMGENIRLLEDLFTLFKADKLGTGREDLRIEESTRIMHEKLNALINEKSPLSIKDLNIKGTDLINMGLPVDSTLSKTLKMLLDAVLNEEIENTKEALINHTRRFINSGAI